MTTQSQNQISAVIQHQTIQPIWKGLDIAGLQKINKTHHTKIDVLVLSCAWHRARNSLSDSANLNVVSLQSPELTTIVKECDIECAAAIRQFYERKLIVTKLRGVELTKFRLDLEHFIQTDGLQYTENQSGMIYRLPEFYEYDTVIETIRLGLCDNSAPQYRRNSDIKKLSPITKLKQNRKYSSQCHYWFLDADQAPVMFATASHNNMLSIFDTLFSTRSSITLGADWYPRNVDGFEHYRAAKINYIEL